MNTKRKGAASELIAAARFASLGWAVLLPFGDNERYDVVIDRGHGFERIQVKTGSLNGGRIQFTPKSESYSAPARSYLGEADFFAVVFDNRVFLVPVEHVGTSSAYLRLTAPKNGQRSKIRWAVDYEI